MMGYCVKCRAKRNMTAPKMGRMKNGRKYLKGKCSKCKTTMMKFVKG